MESKETVDAEEIKNIIFSRGRIENQRGLLDKRNLVGKWPLRLDYVKLLIQSLPDFLQEPVSDNDIELVDWQMVRACNLFKILFIWRYTQIVLSLRATSTTTLFPWLQITFIFNLS